MREGDFSPQHEPMIRSGFPRDHVLSVEITFEGMVVGDLLWLLVIAFLFVIITGMVG
jgi:hypothetical protein